MDILQAFKLTDNVNLNEIKTIGTLEEPLFKANQIAKILEITNIHDNISDYTDKEKTLLLENTSNGNHEKTFLTEIGLYKLLGRSRKPIAHTFQSWMINTIKQIRVDGFYKLKEENEVDKQLIISNCDLIVHKNLIKAYDQKNVVYICKLRNVDDKKLIKIGSTQNIKERMSHMNGQYDNILTSLIDIVEINNYRKFEKYLHNNDYIKNYYYKILRKDGVESKETYLVNDTELEYFLKIINENKKNYQDIDLIKAEELKLKYMDKEVEKENISLEIENISLEKEQISLEKEKLLLEKELALIKQKELELEIKKFNLENNIKNTFEQQLESGLDTIIHDNTINNSDLSDSDSNYNSEEEIDLTKINFYSKKMKVSKRAPKVYQYNPDNLETPINVYESPSEVECSKELKHLGISPVPLRNSSKNNTIYKGYRWLFLNRTELPPEKIPDTHQSSHSSPQIKLLAMIDVKKTKILNVFSSQKEAVEARNMKSNSFTRAIQQYSISSGHYWKFFEDCPQEWQDEYLKTNKLPEKQRSSSGKGVQQICPKTMNVLKIYPSNRDVVKEFKMSSVKLRESMKTGEIHNGYIWKSVL
jgi:prophage antirepressor-like protein